MRLLLIIGLLLLRLDLYPQSRTIFTISGTTIESRTKLPIPECQLKIVSPSGYQYATVSDSAGNFTFDSISTIDNMFEATCRRDHFYSELDKIYFKSTPHDTVVNFVLTFRQFKVSLLPDIYFAFNDATFDRKFQNTLDSIVHILKVNPGIKIKVLGLRDSSETIDQRIPRAKAVAEELIKNGISENRLKIEVSDDPNILKSNTVETEYKTGLLKTINLTEQYIMKNSIGTEQERLRQMNRCVVFQIISI